jgi:hypothetical protein
LSRDGECDKRRARLLVKQYDGIGALVGGGHDRRS